jgi:hypothetical protein
VREGEDPGGDFAGGGGSAPIGRGRNGCRATRPGRTWGRYVEGKGVPGPERRWAWARGLGPTQRNSILFVLFKNFSNGIESI